MRHNLEPRAHGAAHIICRVAATFAVAWAVAGHPVAAFAGPRHAAMVVDANTGRVLHARAADEPRFPASLAKMMTLYIVFEQMQQGRLEGATRIPFSATAAGTAPSKLGLREGAEISLSDAIKTLITKSANDVAVAVAEKIAGSEANFARLMTRKAHALGMKATVFRNAHGLPHPAQVTTARDMITLALRLNDDFPRYYGLFATRAFRYDGETYRNHNTLLGRFEGVDGIKTGYTSASGFNLVASVRRDGKHVVGVVFGGASARARNATMRALLTRALARASTRKTRRPLLLARASLDREEPGRPSSSSTPPDRRRSEPDRPRQAAPMPPADAGDRNEPRLLQAPRIEIARVRPVPVAPRWTRSAPSPRVELAAARDEPDAGARAFGGGLAPARGAAPSSLEAQAERMSRGLAPVAPAWGEASARAPSDGGASAFAVQVGAFGSEAEARRQLQSALDRSEGLLDGRLPTTQPVRHAGRQLYRARFSGFDQRTAALACRQLKSRNIDCHVARAE